MSRIERLERAWISLQGLAVGDAFGQCFFGPEDEVGRWLAQRELPAPVWRYTDDTAMALSIFETLASNGVIDQDELADRFARRFTENRHRGYGAGSFQLLTAVASGRPWRPVSQDLFNGAGSFGNGAAMRVAPVGAFFADSLDAAVREAKASAEVTHAHPEGIAGAVAIAAAAAAVGATSELSTDTLLHLVLDHTPPSRTRQGIEAARALPSGTTVQQAVEVLGNGGQVAAFDTVPYCIWCVANWRHDFQAAMWSTVAGFGDRDTTCAIVGGIISLAARPPRSFVDATEPLPVSPPLLSNLTRGRPMINLIEACLVNERGRPTGGRQNKGNALPTAIINHAAVNRRYCLYWSFE